MQMLLISEPSTESTRWARKQFQDAKQQTTPKSMRAEWTGGDGEAGNHVELKAGGGIAGFHISRDDGASLLDLSTMYQR
jgi:hypothetical protein